MRVSLFIQLFFIASLLSASLTGLGYSMYTIGKQENVRPVVLKWDEQHKETLYNALDGVGVYLTDEQKRDLDTKIKSTKKRPVGFSNN